MRITKKLVLSEIDILNNMLNLPIGSHFKHDNFYLQGAYEGWQLQKSGQCYTNGFMPLKEVYLQVRGMVKGVELAKDYL